MDEKIIYKRGTVEWDLREASRRSKGCRALSFGEIPNHEVSRVVTSVANTRQMPTPERMAELRARHNARHNYAVKE